MFTDQICIPKCISYQLTIFFILLHRKCVFCYFNFIFFKFQSTSFLEKKDQPDSLANSSCVSPCFCWTTQISQWRLNNIHLKRQSEKGEREEEMNKKQREKQEQRGYEGFCHTERFLMSNKPHRRVVKRRPHSQAFELSKALPCTHGQTYVPPPPPPRPTLLHTNPIHTRFECVFPPRSVHQLNSQS